jgi:hypothetical protein
LAPQFLWNSHRLDFLSKVYVRPLGWLEISSSETSEKEQNSLLKNAMSEKDTAF